MDGQGSDPELQHVVLTVSEITDLIATLEIRVQDERRMYFAATDARTRQGCLDASTRLQALLRRLHSVIGMRTA